MRAVRATLVRQCARALCGNRIRTLPSLVRHFSVEAASSTSPTCDEVHKSQQFQWPTLQPGEVMPGVTTDEIALRRRKLMSTLPEGSLIIFISATVKYMTDIVPYPFRQGSNYLYYTGCQDPGGVAVIYNEGLLCMFMPDPDPEEIVWQGRVAEVLEAKEILKADRAYKMSELPKVLPRLLKQAKAVYVDDEVFEDPSDCILDKIEAYKDVVQQKKVHTIQRYCYEPRWIKSPAEIELMRHSAAITSQAFIETMKLSRTRPHEHILAARMEFECRARGAHRLAFPPVVAGGVNTTVIHYFRNDQQIREDEMVLMDAGCDYYGYSSEMTRTWSPSGKLSNAQKDLYQAVLHAHKECVPMYKPGVTVGEIHNKSTDILQRATRGLGIVKTRAQYNQVNPTSVGRYIGLDTLDCKTIHEDRKLLPGVVVMVEPGLYIPISDEFPKWFQGIGIRIADEILITETGHEVLTDAVPRELGEIEALLGSCKQ